MKPLIRQFIYDRLRKSLYKHEIKRLVWNNPYYPFYTKEGYEWGIAELVNKFDGDKNDLNDYVKFCHEHIKQCRANNLGEIESILDNIFVMVIDTDLTNTHLDSWLLYTMYGDNIIEGIEKRYGILSNNK